MEFLTSKSLGLNPAGYLINKETSKPVGHTDFVNAQKSAEYIVKLSEAIKGKTFTAGKLDDLNAIKASVRDAINNTTQTYGTVPVKPTGELTSKLADEAMAFLEFDSKKSKFTQINTFMQTFNSIKAVEEVGDYFTENVVKLAKIYTISEIQAAVEATIEILA
jgi:hypothetical protein